MVPLAAVFLYKEKNLFIYMMMSLAILYQCVIFVQVCLGTLSVNIGRFIDEIPLTIGGQLLPGQDRCRCCKYTRCTCRDGTDGCMH